MSALPVLVLDTVIRATGELIGYAVGAPASFHDRLDEYEIHKAAYTRRPGGSPSTFRRAPSS